PRLLVGGVSNSREAGFFAVLDARHVQGAGPEAPGSPFECLTCAPGRPLRYFTIRPSELALTNSPYNYVVGINADEAGVEVRTFETRPPFALNVEAIARFSPDFALQHVGWSSAWSAVHRDLERAGKLDHSEDECPERGQRPHVREWTPEAGWRDVTPPSVAFAPTRAAGLDR
ncbi:MAG TPA: hypothetical protein VLF95_03180, partial [Vicinamibacteria bacterium]|nr:hypothetical protein [Vicinamibacteria bacterium]